MRVRRRATQGQPLEKNSPIITIVLYLVFNTASNNMVLQSKDLQQMGISDEAGFHPVDVQLYIPAHDDLPGQEASNWIKETAIVAKGKEFRSTGAAVTSGFYVTTIPRSMTVVASTMSQLTHVFEELKRKTHHGSGSG